jgi:TonB-linked SusC/RagA family outer membrane protein
LFRVNYNLKDKYLLTASLRRDGSSRFPTNNRYGTFPAIGLGWRLSEEPFIRDLGLFDNLKLRASYGKLGNTNIPNYLYYPRIANNLNAVFGQSQTPQIGATELNPVAANLLWETVTQTDIGLEIGVLNNRLTFEADYYNRRTDDLILKARRPVVGEIETNTATAVNRGFEFGATWSDQRENFRYSIGGNLTTVHNEVTDLGNGGIPLIGGSLGNGLTATITNVGSSIGAFYGYQVAGVFQPSSDIAGSAQPGARPGDLIFRDVNGRDENNEPTGRPDGKIDENDRVYLGTPIPKVFWGLNTSFGYRGLDLVVDLQGNHGNKIYNGKRAVRFGNENYEAALLDRWTPQNPSNSEPRVTNGGQNYAVSSYFIESGSFVRIRNVQIGYTLPKGLLDGAKLTTARIYVSALNPVTFTKYSGFSPEVGIADPAAQTASINRGIDVDIVPTYATYTVGLNIGF